MMACSRPLLCALLVVTAGCASSRLKPGQIGGPPGETHMEPEAVLEKDLPPPEAPPIEIRWHAESDPQARTTSYVYTVSNGTPYRITDFHIGSNPKDGANAIKRPPLGLTEDGRMPAGSYGAPAGWTLLYEGNSHSPGALTWTAQAGDAIEPGECLTGFRVAVASRDKSYERTKWFALVTSGDAGTYTGTLVSTDDPVPAGDPVDRLGRLSISPRVSRGVVRIRYRTHQKARPIVAILDAKGEVIRKYDQDKRRVRDREVVWDRQDQSGNVVPPGEYFVRIRYGYTERYGRVTLVR